MNVFVLCTGRCGSLAFATACNHITNYTAGHETGHRRVGRGSFQYPDNHIEVDCRLAWRLGRLQKQYGRNAFYVHLMRNASDTARSYHAKMTKKNHGLARAWFEVNGHPITPHWPAMLMDMVFTVRENIEAFLADKDHMTVRIEEAKDRFPGFWNHIGAQGDLSRALAEFDKGHNRGVLNE